MGISKHLLSPPAKCTTSLPEANNIPFPLPFIHPLEHTLPYLNPSALKTLKSDYSCAILPPPCFPFRVLSALADSASLLSVHGMFG